MKQRKKIKDLSREEQEYPTGRNIIFEDDLLGVLEEYLKDAEDARDSFEKSIAKLSKDNKSIFLYLCKSGEDARINLLKYLLGRLE